MGDLEETIFQRNVVGRYSSWDREDKSDRRHGDDENFDISPPVEDDDDCMGEISDTELMKYAQQLSNSDIPESVRQTILAERAGKSATGVKGVMADYKASKALERAQAQADAEYRKQVLTRIAEGCKVSHNTQEVANANEYIHQESSQWPHIDTDDDDDDDDDDAFMREFRAKRMKEIKEATTASSAARVSSSSCASNANAPAGVPVFGTVREIRNADFLNEIEEEDARVIVAVHLYEPGIQSCTRMNEILQEIAITFPHVKFLRMQASSNTIEVDKVALPIITLYRNGETVDTIAGIAAEFGPYFKKDDIEWLLNSSLKSALSI
mmetsp:Transcript_31216/g.52681  ORF Transcript_31216/g.52681 Transcript_31216/m.52681 type:complete len:325 (+) Transcript_31216:37-1011(+)